MVAFIGIGAVNVHYLLNNGTFPVKGCEIIRQSCEYGQARGCDDFQQVNEQQIKVKKVTDPKIYIENAILALKNRVEHRITKIYKKDDLHLFYKRLREVNFLVYALISRAKGQLLDASLSTSFGVKESGCCRESDEGKVYHILNKVHQTCLYVLNMPCHGQTSALAFYFEQLMGIVNKLQMQIKERLSLNTIPMDRLRVSLDTIIAHLPMIEDSVYLSHFDALLKDMQLIEMTMTHIRVIGSTVLNRRDFELVKWHVQTSRGIASLDVNAKADKDKAHFALNRIQEILRMKLESFYETDDVRRNGELPMLSGAIQRARILIKKQLKRVEDTLIRTTRPPLAVVPSVLAQPPTVSGMIVPSFFDLPTYMSPSSSKVSSCLDAQYVTKIKSVTILISGIKKPIELLEIQSQVHAIHRIYEEIIATLGRV